MVRALVLTHGAIGTELVRVAEMILGPQQGLAAASNSGRSADDIGALVTDWLAAAEGPALILIDDYGGSCATAARLASDGRDDVKVVSGVNLAMVLGYLTWREGSGPSELAQRIIDKGREAIILLGRR